MSAETEMRVLLVAHAPLTALVADRVALNAVPQDSAHPLVVFTTTQVPDLALDNTVLGIAVSHSVQCWGGTSAAAQAVADAVRGALAANADYVVLAEASAFDEELGLDAVQLTVERWIT
jgi:hypothetical protein